MITRPDGSLYASYGVMGGWNQPQGQTQVVVNLIDRGMDAQSAIDAPRVSMYEEPPNGRIYVEDTFGVDVLARLAELGHPVVPATGAIRTGVVGKGQIIYRDPRFGSPLGRQRSSAPTVAPSRFERSVSARRSAEAHPPASRRR